jgi:flavorubredoxin
MAESVARGAASIDGVTVALKEAAEATVHDLFDCSGLAIGSPEYFGYMSGMIKDFFDRTYDDARGKSQTFRKPYVVFISAGNDGTGALRSIERICIGYQFKRVYDPLIATGQPTEAVLKKCEELGKTLAAGCEAGIY